MEAPATNTRMATVIHQYLRSSARIFPERAAIRSQKQGLSYRELDSITDRVAVCLRSYGVCKGDRVGIYVPKSLASVVSIYSILKAGGVYVPFDPEAPAERLSLISQDCDIRTVLSCTAKLDGVKSMIDKGAPIVTIVMIDTDGVNDAISTSTFPDRVRVIPWERVLSSDGVPSWAESVETDTAYILYTSGSTGVPKGVMISHRNCMSFVDWSADYIRLTATDVVGCHAPLHFDISTFSIFSTCKAGGTVLMVPEKTSMFPTLLAKLMEEEDITVWYSVPSILTLLVLYGALESRNLSRLRAIVFAGEVFPVKYLRQLMAAIHHARYYNWYGPTETNVCTSYEVTRLESDRETPIPIGTACSSDAVFALDSEGKRITETGRRGQLYVMGPTVMQGYWGDSDKTTKVLVRNPLNPNSGELAYRTGDIVSLDADGNYLYLGREDGMIKSRGYRVELAEIEAVMYTHPDVKEVAVVPVPDEVLGNRIHAYVSRHSGSNLKRDELLAHLGAKLPRYMIPETLDFSESLPKTPNGKIDRVALARLALGWSETT